MLRALLAAAALNASLNATAQTPEWSALVAPPVGSGALANCVSAENVTQAASAAESIVRHLQGDVFTVSCPAETPATGSSVASTAIAVERLSGASGSRLWRREFAGTQVSYYTLIRNFISLDVAGNVVVASSVSSEESGEFTYALKFDGTTGQPAWQTVVNAPTLALDVLTSGDVQLNNGNVSTTLFGSTGTIATLPAVGQPLPDRGGVPLVSGGSAYLALASADGRVRRVAKFLNAGLPGVPTITSTFSSNELISISFLPPASDGGASILDYGLICREGGVGGPATVQRAFTASPAIYVVDFDVTPGYLQGHALNCTLRARNYYGFGMESATRTFFSSQTPLSLHNVVSRKSHGTSGDFELTIARNLSQSGPVTIEPRVAGSGHLIVFQFTKAVDSVSGLSVQVGMLPAIPLTNYSMINNELRVLLPAASVPDGSRVHISGSINGSMFSFAESIGFLLGDSDSSRAVDSTDVTAIRARSGQRASLENFRFDITASGVVSSSDILATRAHSGRLLDN